jgi:hypothetical protein
VTTSIEVAEVRRAILTTIWAHRRRMREWERVLDRGGSPTEIMVASANFKAHRVAIAALRDVLDQVQAAVAERDAAFGGYVEWAR